MSRKRAEIKSKKSYKKNYSRIYIVLLIIVMLCISGLAVIVYNTGKENNTDEEKIKNENNESDDRWLFAMDTDNIQYKYQANAIPTLVIMDKNGDVVFYGPGYHSKDQLLPYIEDAISGTAESLAESIDFTVTTFNNEDFTLSKHKGEVIILDIMGVGCPPCEMQMPELQKIKKEKGNSITIISIDTYYSGETKEDVLETYRDYIKLG
jgi:hypothetical protein